MKIHGVLFLIIAILTLVSCNEVGVLVVSGNVSGLSSPKVGLFSPGAPFEFDSETFSNDVMSDGNAHVPVVVVTPDGDGNYSIEFPSDPTTVGYLVAWTEYTDDGIFNPDDDEQAVFPLKDFDGSTYIITGWAVIADIVQALFDGTASGLNLESVGAGGFDFYPYSPVD